MKIIEWFIIDRLNNNKQVEKHKLIISGNKTIERSYIKLD